MSINLENTKPDQNGAGLASRVRNLHKNHQHMIVVAVVVLGIGLSVAAFFLDQAWQKQQIRNEFEIEAANAINALGDDMRTALAVLQSIESLYSASTFVDRNEFQTFVEGILIRNPGIQGLSWNPRVADLRRADAENLAQEEGFVSFQFLQRGSEGELVTATQRSEYYPVYYIEPRAGNEAALGFDVSTNPTRLEAMEKARDTGQYAATSKITLVQETEEQAGILVFQPIYHNGSAREALVDRRENLAGFAVGVFRVGDLLEYALAGTNLAEIGHPVEVQVYDETGGSGHRLLFVGSSPTSARAEQTATFQMTKSLNIGQREWEVVVSGFPSPWALWFNWRSWAILSAGLVFIGLLFLHLLSGLRHSARIEQTVAERTSELMEANQELEMEIRERQQAEEALHLIEKHRRALLDAIPDAIFRIDRDGTFLDFKSAGVWDSYAAPENFIGKNIHEVLPPNVAEQCMQNADQARQSGEIQFFEYQLPLEGKTIDYEARIVVSGADEVVAIVRDVTERLAVDRMKREFVSICSHELRTPLTAIRASLGLLGGGVLGSLSDKAQHLVDIAVSNTDRLVRLINDILDIERMESGQITIDKRRCGAGDLMLQGAAVMEDLARASGVVLSVSPISAEVEGDPDRIIQTITNLVSNAIKFSPEGTKVSVSGQEQGRQVLFEVRDEGRGIPKDNLESVFESFQQVDASDSREKGGTGLGLAICRSIVRQHGGQIWVESKLGEGSVFKFTIPIFQDKKEGQNNVEEASINSGR